jgi:hypothetical protein
MFKWFLFCCVVGVFIVFLYALGKLAIHLLRNTPPTRLIGYSIIAFLVYPVASLLNRLLEWAKRHPHFETITFIASVAALGVFIIVSEEERARTTRNEELQQRLGQLNRSESAVTNDRQERPSA